MVALNAVGFTVTDLPDTRSLEGDIGELLRSFRRILRHPLARRILLDPHAEARPIGRDGGGARPLRPLPAPAARANRARCCRDNLSPDIDGVRVGPAGRADLLADASHARRCDGAYLECAARSLAAELRCCLLVPEEATP